MKTTQRLTTFVSLLVAITFSVPAPAEQLPQSRAFGSAVAPRPVAGAIWKDPGNIPSLDLLHGPGGPSNQPSGKFTFVKADTGGSTPKFDVVDSNGVMWKVKLGDEAKSETAAARLLWAMGYFADEDYYLLEIQVEKMPKIRKLRKYVSAGGRVHGARLERMIKDQNRERDWSWYKNPMTGSKELDGLRVMMALMNNWDLKRSNNGIYINAGSLPRYAITDIGASFGKTGNTFVRSKSKVQDYSRSKFIQKVTPEHVDFHLNSRPFFLTVFHLPNYIRRTKMQSVAKNIPRTHAAWMGKMLAQLTPGQLRDCFTSAGYSPLEVEKYSQSIHARIAELKAL